MVFVVGVLLKISDLLAPILEDDDASMAEVRELPKLSGLVISVLVDDTVVSGVRALSKVSDLLVSVLDDNALELLEFVDPKKSSPSSMISHPSAGLSLLNQGIFLLGALPKTTAPSRNLKRSAYFVALGVPAWRTCTRLQV